MVVNSTNINNELLKFSLQVQTEVLNNPSKQYELGIKEYHKKRSLTANAYMWTLCEKLAQKLKTTKDEIYKFYVKSQGVFRQISLDESAAKTIRKVWESQGTGWITEQVDYSGQKGFVIINAYYGSSSYNSKQMSRLVDEIVEDCKEQGIETMSEAEIESLKQNWNKQKKEK